MTNGGPKRTPLIRKASIFVREEPGKPMPLLLRDRTTVLQQRVFHPEIKKLGDYSYVEKHGIPWIAISSIVDFGKTTNQNWVLIDPNAKIFFDEKDDFFQNLLRKTISECAGKSKIADILAVVNENVNQLTDMPHLTRRQVEESLDARDDAFEELHRKQQGKSKIESIDIDLADNVREKILVCRHKSVIVGALLGTLVKNGILPPGQVRMYQSHLVRNDKSERGAHAWTLYRDNSNQLWICDPRWEKVYNVNDQRGLLTEDFLYGQYAIQDMQTRADILDGIVSENFKSCFEYLSGVGVAKASPIGDAMVLTPKDFSDLVFLSNTLDSNNIAYSTLGNHPNLYLCIKQSDNVFIYQALLNAIKEADPSKLRVVFHDATSKTQTAEAQAVEERRKQAQLLAEHREAERIRQETEMRAREEQERIRKEAELHAQREAQRIRDEGEQRAKEAADKLKAENDAAIASLTDILTNLAQTVHGISSQLREKAESIPNQTTDKNKRNSIAKDAASRPKPLVRMQRIGENESPASSNSKHKKHKKHKKTDDSGKHGHTKSRHRTKSKKPSR